MINVHVKNIDSIFLVLTYDIMGSKMTLIKSKSYITQNCCGVSKLYWDTLRGVKNLIG